MHDPNRHKPIRCHGRKEVCTTETATSPSCQVISLRRHELANDPDFAEGFADDCLEVWKEGDSEQ